MIAKPFPLKILSLTSKFATFIFIDDCTKDGVFIFLAKHDRKIFLINKLRRIAPLVMQVSSSAMKYQTIHYQRLNVYINDHINPKFLLL